MPDADGRISGENEGELVVVLCAVDGVDEADEWVFGTGEWLCGHGHGIFDTAIVQRQIHPFVGGV